MRRVLVTGGAGFIGSHIVDALVARGDEVVVLDNFATGFRENLAHLDGRIALVEADLRDLGAVQSAMAGCTHVCHQGALGSVPRSIDDPKTTNDVNVGGTLNVLIAANDAGVHRLVNASSSSVYGDTPELPKHEGMPFRPKSPYALSKATAEEYARVFHVVYGSPTVTLRYFNIFGPRQTPNSQYAAAIPLFITAMLRGESPRINGDGSNSRDFTYVANAVHANLKALDAPEPALGRSYNVGAGGQVTLNELVAAINAALGTTVTPVYGPPRPGDVDHSRAAIALASELLGYAPQVTFRDGVAQAVESYRALA